jgi:hypothetical protein
VPRKSHEVQQTKDKSIKTINVQQRDIKEKRRTNLRPDKEKPTPQNGL